MNIYLISQNENNGFNTYDSAVVTAEDEVKARAYWRTWTLTMKVTCNE